jgi:uncharacterized membrane protein YqjE
VLIAVPAEQRVWVAGGAALLFFAAALFIAWQVRREAKARPFAASIAELERDADALRTGE